MKSVQMSEMKERIEFVERAAKHFAEFPEHSTFTVGPVMSGCLFAARWGLDNDCVLMFRLDEDFEPIIFGQAIAKKSPAILASHGRA